MNKIKKWHIVVLIILSIGGYWLFQNMWVFEERIPIEEYEEFIENTKWIEMKEKVSVNWDFTLTNLDIYVPNIEDSISYTGEWKIVNNNEIHFIGNASNNSREVYWAFDITFLSNKTLLLEPNSIYLGGLKKLKISK